METTRSARCPSGSVRAIFRRPPDRPPVPEPRLNPQSVRIIANPSSGGGKGRRAVARLGSALEMAGIPAPVLLTSGPGHAEALAREAALAGAERLLVVGGDGTIHEVANGLLGLDGAEGRALPALAVLPVGTGNDFHRMVLGGGGGVEGTLRLLREGRPRAFDVGVVRWPEGERYFVNLLGVGVDAEVLRRRAGFRRLRGLLQYLAALGVALVRYRCLRLVIEARGRENPGGNPGPGPQEGGAPGGGEGLRFDAELLLAAVTVGPSVGGGFFLSPEASPDDGALDLFAVERLGLLRIMRYLPRALRSQLGGEPEVHRGLVTSVTFRAPDGVPFDFELDGELIATRTATLEIGIRPACLPVLDLPEGVGR